MKVQETNSAHYCSFSSNCVQAMPRGRSISFACAFPVVHYPNITLNNCPEIWAEKHNQRDIEIFTHQKLLHLSQTSDNRRLVESILNQADGVFLWVDLTTLRSAYVIL